MIPEHASRAEMKRTLEILCMNPERHDRELSFALKYLGFDAQILGYESAPGRYDYIVTFAFKVPSFLNKDDVDKLLRRAARDGYMWLYHWEIHHTHEWHHGTASFYGLTPFAGGHWSSPSQPGKVEKHVLEIVALLKRQTEQENRHVLAYLRA